jgi:hypothetical protein
VRKSGLIPRPHVGGSGAAHVLADRLYRKRLHRDGADAVRALFLALFLIPVTVVSHPFWKSADPTKRRQQFTSFLRNATLLRGCVLLFILFTAQPQISFTLTSPFFSRR